ncbi:hypothetical protein C8A05DRAFT_38101 [Staphylotrichum tortipilum]|uniref:Endothelin-converting enzyme 1 n=1 Tax=Staphylotrichum tortipilum TaxID=2831512 RepID=A0AAN6ME71_9PEZI|nr:hypothetical protein C8A05DRAFT_38101 [Staphylotrichum longicolle]
MGQWQSQEVCTTPACIHAASTLLKGLHPNWAQIDPCTDFDKMVCYGAPEHFGEDGGTMAEMGKRTANILRKILESPNHAAAAGVKSTLSARATTEEDNFNMLRTAYAACMNVESIVNAGVQPLADLIITVNKAWPVPPTDLKTAVSEDDVEGFQTASLLLEGLGVPAFHSYCMEGPIMPDYLDAKTNRVCFGAPKLLFQGNNISAYFDPSAMSMYSKVVASAFSLTYPKISDENAVSLADAVVLFEMDLANIIAPYAQAAAARDDQGYGTIQNVTLQEIATAAPVFGFEKIIATLTPGKTPPGFLLDEPTFWPEFNNLIANHSRAAVHGYIMWKTIGTFARDVVSTDLWTAMGIEPRGERWEQCIESTDGMLRHILEHYFVLATYPDASLQAAEKMTTNVRKQFEKRISTLDWMSTESKTRAVKKAENIQQNIGYPRSNPNVRSATDLAAFYSNLTLTATHFTNLLLTRQHASLLAFAAISSPPDRKNFGNIADINAFYTPWTNSITIPVGISQLPIFHPSLPLYATYGTLGSVIGHEITHGFDSSGRHWSEDAERESFWDNSTVSAFSQRAQCFVEQYSAFQVEGAGGAARNVDGLATLGENLSDAGGLRAAYDAWVAERKAMPATWDQKLPGLEKFTSEQMFFIAYASTWCDTPSPERMELILMGEHAPSVTRIKGGAQNSRAFREAWKCKVKEPVCELF